MGTPARTAIYLRQSLDRNGNELAVQRQRDECRALCVRRGWSSPVEYVDNNRSASKGQRPAYQRLLADIRDGFVTRVVVWDLDRLHRRPIELEEFIGLADRNDVALASVSGDVDLSTSNGRLYARLKGAVARQEVEHKADRQRLAHRQRVAEGTQWGPRAFGYEDRDPEVRDSRPNLRVRDAEAQHIRNAYASVLSGVSLSAIAKELNRAGVRTTTGGQWRSTQVRRTLLNARYAGLQQHNGDVVEGVTSESPAIVDAETWHAVRAMLSDPARVTNGRAEGRKYLLSGLALCGECGHTLTSGNTHTDAKRYVCRQCGRVGRSMRAIDGYVNEVVAQRLSQPDAVDILKADDTPDAETLRAEATAIRAQMDSLAVTFADGVITERQLRAASTRLRERLDGVEQQLHDAHKVRIFDGLIGHDDVAARIAELPLSRRRAVVEALLTVVVLPGARRGPGFDPDKVVIVWN